MARPRPEGQVARILDAAERTFVRVGFRRAKVATVAAEAGISTATVYHYFENKDALFVWALRRATRPDLRLPQETPLGLTRPLNPAALVRSLANIEQERARFDAALAAAPADPIEEFRHVVRAYFDDTWRSRRAVDLLEAIAMSEPDVRDIWFNVVGANVVSIWSSYLRSRPEILGDGDAETAAMFIISNCIFFARKGLHTFEAQTDPQVNRALVIDALVGGISAGAYA